ncbi:MAG: hypothetical protein ACRCUX_05165, partial [Beijerinckiaceae bacterium]
MWSVSFTPLIAPALFWSLAALALIAALATLYFKGGSGVLRIVALGALVFALGDPALRKEDREPLKDIVAIVVDKSASQRIANRMEQTERARSEIQRRLDALPNIETRLIEVNDTDAGADGTKLFTAIQSGLADVPSNRIGGIIAITDGVVHDIPASIDALPFRAPLHALVTGRAGERDRRIELVEAPKFGIVGKDIVIRARVMDTMAEGAMVRLTIKRDGVVISEIPAGIGQTVRIPIRIEHGGTNVVEMEVGAAPNELTQSNNRAVVTVEGVREKLRVLLVSGEPHAGERTWRNLLKSDANVDLVHFTILRPPEKQDGTPINELSLIAFPTRELFGEKIKEFDLIIFDRYANQSILPRLYFENIVRYVRDGGAVMIAAGAEYAGVQSLSTTPLAQVIPARPDGRVIEEPYLARITQIGRRHPVTRELPGGETEPPTWGEWVRLVSTRLRTGTAVMNGPNDAPLMVLARESKGRVAIILSDHAWLWARKFQDGGPHLEMLRRVSHWLMKEPQLEEEYLRGSARGKVITVERQTMADAAKPVTLTTPNGMQKSVALRENAPGRFSGQIETDEIGLHRLTDETLTAFVGVGPDNPRELRDVLSNTELLRPLIEQTGGSIRRVSANGDDFSLPSLVPMRSATRYGSGDMIGLRSNDQSTLLGVGMWPVF